MKRCGRSDNQGRRSFEDLLSLISQTPDLSIPNQDFTEVRRDHVDLGWDVDVSSLTNIRQNFFHKPVGKPGSAALQFGECRSEHLDSTAPFGFDKDPQSPFHLYPETSRSKPGWTVVRQDQVGLMLHREADGRSLSWIKMSSQHAK